MDPIDDQSHLAGTPQQGALAAAVSSTLGGLGGGMLWCAASVWLVHGTRLLIVPIALLLSLFFRWQRFHGTRAVLCAIAATSIAFAYAYYLFAAVRIAQMMGLPLREALMKAGIALTADVAWGNFHAADAGLLGVAVMAGVGGVLSSVGQARRNASEPVASQASASG